MESKMAEFKMAATFFTRVSSIWELRVILCQIFGVREGKNVFEEKIELIGNESEFVSD